ncbi:MAG: DUF1189 family protein [Oligosphaeraceae bacterium]|nr:DUF1189 family protein [Oligosphaeraceae bacterium]
MSCQIEQPESRPNSGLPPVMSYWHLLITLFIHPRYGNHLARRSRKYWRGIFMLLLITIVGAGVKAMSTLPQLSSNLREIAAFLSAELGDISFVDSKIKWSNELEEPVSKRLGNLRVDVLPKDSDEQRRQLALNPGKNGVIVTADGVDFWIRYRGSEQQVQTVPLLTPKLIDALSKTSWAGESPPVFSGDGLQKYMQILSFALLPALTLSYSLSMLACIVFFVFFFVVMMFLSRQSGTLSEYLAAVTHCCIPPFLVASLYNIFLPALTGFENVFGIIFLVYLGFMFVEDKWSRPEPNRT